MNWVILESSAEFLQNYAVGCQSLLHTSLDMIATTLIDSVQTFNVPHHYLNTELNIGKVFKTQQHNLSLVIQHKQMHVYNRQYLQLPLRQHILMLFQIIVEEV